MDLYEMIAVIVAVLALCTIFCVMLYFISRY